MEDKQWVKLEEDITGIQLKALPWIKSLLRPGNNILPIFVRATLKIWDA